MKRTLLALFIALSFAMPHIKPAAAQSPDPEKTQPPGREDQATWDQNARDATHEGRADQIDRPDRRRRRPRRQDRDTPLELARKLPKLKVLMWEALDLDRSQKDAIATLFDEEMDRLKAIHAEARDVGGRKEDIQKARDLQKELMEARKSGDPERARALRQELGHLLGASRRGGPQAVRIDGFLGKVNDELSDSQRSEFRGLVGKAGLRQRRRGRGGPMLAFRRALFSPEVDLSQDQRREVMQLIRDSRARFNPGRPHRGPDDQAGDAEPNEEHRDQGRPAPGDRAEQIKQLQQAVLKLLDEQQRERFEATLEKMQNEPPEPFRRRGDRGPGRGRWRDRGEF